MRRLNHATIIALALLSPIITIAGCAGPSLSSGSYGGTSFADQRLTTGSTSLSASPIDTASNTEDVNCKRLSGNMQIRLLSLRSNPIGDATSALSKGIQSVVTSVMGGPQPALADAEKTADYQRLKLDNARLKDAGCKTFDIEAALANPDTSHTPRPR